MENLIRTYVALGWHLFPLIPNSKKPLLSASWKEIATTDLNVIAGWLRDNPQMNLGVSCGHSSIYVIDVDKKHGGMETLASVQRSLKRFPPTLTARTPSGGLHLIYNAPEPRHGVKFGNKELDNFGYAGIETRGNGGFIVIAPSYTTALWKGEKQDRWEGRYEWDNNLSVAELPEWFLDMLAPKPSISQRAMMSSSRGGYQSRFGTGSGLPAARLRGAATKLASLPHNSGRNQYLNDAVFGILVDAKGAISPNEVYAVMREAAFASGLEPKEIELTLKSAIGAAMTKIGRAT